MSPESYIAHYRIVSQLGAGGMGAVYRASDTKLNRDVAIKVLPEAFARDPDRMARFTREAQVLAALNHSNIATIYGVEANAIVMELVEGADLQGPLPVETALGYARQIAEALEAAHEKGIVHRDLKPANVKVTPEGVVKVLDFGLAKAAEPAPAPSSANSPTLTMRATEAGVIMGTAAYMAPEQAAGKTVDKRADIWSFGVVLYELLRGGRLFDGETAAHTLAHVLTREIDLSGIDAPLRPLLRRCLERDPRKRLRDIGDARLAIDDYLAGAPAVPAAAAPARGSKTPWIVAGAFAVALIPASIGWFRQAPVVQLRPLVRFDIQPGPETDSAALTNRLAISPDGQRIVYGARDGERRRLASWLLDQAVSAPISGSEDAVNPAISPDGDWLAATDGSSKLKRIPLRGGVAQELAAAGVAGVSWSRDGVYYRVGTRSVISFVPTAGGPPRNISQFANGEVTHRYPQAAAGGRVLIFTSSTHGGNYEDAEIAGVDVKSGRRVTLRRNGYYGRYLGPDDGPGFLLSMSQGVLHAQPMDPLRLTVSEPALPVLPGVATDPTTGVTNLDVSSTGTLVFTEGKSRDLPRLQLIERAGKATPLTPATGRFAGIRLSPDGKRVAYWMPGADQGIWTLDLIDGTRTRITFDADLTPSLPTWSHDGKHILYIKQGEVRWIRSDGGGQPQPLFRTPDALSCVAPDGRSLLLVGRKTLFSVGLEGSSSDRPRASEPRALVTSSGDIFDAVVSPDGKWLAYSSDESGRRAVYVTSFPVPAGKWQVPAGIARFPAWSLRELFFQDSNNRLQSAPYSAVGDSFRLGEARPWGKVSVNGLLLTRNFDVTLDGERVAALRNEESETEAKTPGRITVLLHFYDELVRKFGKQP